MKVIITITFFVVINYVQVSFGYRNAWKTRDIFLLLCGHHVCLVVLAVLTVYHWLLSVSACHSLDLEAFCYNLLS